MFLFYVLSFFKKGDTIQGRTLIKEIRYLFFEGRAIYVYLYKIFSFVEVNIEIVSGCIFFSRFERTRGDKNQIFRTYVLSCFVDHVAVGQIQWVRWVKSRYLYSLIFFSEWFFFIVWTKYLIANFLPVSGFRVWILLWHGVGA